MHGRLKVRTTEEQAAQKHKEQQKKLQMYRMGMKQILSTRNTDSYDDTALNLCAQLLTVNPDIYTLWNYRKEVILIKEKDSNEENVEKLVDFLENELKLTEQCLVANPKSYGSWHHRYWVLEHHPQPNWSHEFDVCNKYLSMDDRNFHVWDYRRLLVNKLGVTLNDEITFTTERITINFSNYSSWHYRSTLRQLDKESVSDELNLVKNAVFTDPADTSAWFYLRWVLSNPNLLKPELKELLQALEELEDLEPDCKWVVIAKCWVTNGLGSDAAGDSRSVSYQRLIVLDPLRKGYYLDCINSH